MRFVGHLHSREEVKKITQAKLKRFARSFEFEGMNARRDGINNAYKETFGWLLGDKVDNGDELQRVPESISGPVMSTSHTFISWVKSESQKPLFWISGKPGSGKSTLMKFLTGHDRALRLLRLALGERVIILSNFLLLLGLPMQRNKKGMMCTMLSQLLGDLRSEDDLAMAQEIFLATSEPEAKTENSDWTTHGLELLFFKALELVGRTRHVCVCIDGLDEFDLHEGGAAAILGIISKSCSIPGVRLIVSSRPEDQLEKGLHEFPRLFLHKLTAVDVYRYARDTFVQSDFDGDWLGPLVEDVVRKSEGVFLWVVLVVKTMIVDLREGCSADALGEVLQELPKEVSDLYHSIWMRRNHDAQRYRSEAALYLNLFIETVRALYAIPQLSFPYWHWQGEVYPKKVARYPVTLLQLALAFDGKLARALLMSDEDINPEVVLAQCKAARSAISIRCAGILEVGDTGIQTSDIQDTVDPESSIRFVHRSAEDFFTETLEGKEILKNTDLESPIVRLNNIVLACLARAWSFRYWVNSHGICVPVFESDFHKFFVAEGLLEKRLSQRDLTPLLEYCQRLVRCRFDDCISHRLFISRSQLVSEGLNVLFWPRFTRLMSLDQHRKAVIVQFALYWQTTSCECYMDLLDWLEERDFLNPDVIRLVQEEIPVPAPFNAFGPMKMPLFLSCAANFVRIVRNTEYFAKGRVSSFGYRKLEWYVDLPKNLPKLRGYFFFDSDTIPAYYDPAVPRVSPFEQLLLHQQDYCFAQFVVVYNFTANGRHLSSDEIFSPSNSSRATSKPRILAIGHVSSSSEWDSSRWIVRRPSQRARGYLSDALDCLFRGVERTTDSDLSFSEIIRNESTLIGDGSFTHYLAELNGASTG